jgi:hypothetical protein
MQIKTGNADEFGNNAIRDLSLLFIAGQDMMNYHPRWIPESVEVDNVFYGLLFEVKQFSLSSEAYVFWKTVEASLKADGRLFSPVMSQPTGNMVCLSDENKRVIGIFTVADVATCCAYFYIGRHNQIINREIDSIPVLYIDSPYPDEPPPGWQTPS